MESNQRLEEGNSMVCAMQGKENSGRKSTVLVDSRIKEEFGAITATGKCHRESWKGNSKPQILCTSHLNSC